MQCHSAGDAATNPGRKRRRTAQEKQVIINEIKQFWRTNYKYEACTQTVSANSVFQLFSKLHPTSNVHPSNFFQKSKDIGIAMKEARTEATVYLAEPSNDASRRLCYERQ